MLCAISRRMPYSSSRADQELERIAVTPVSALSDAGEKLYAIPRDTPSASLPALLRPVWQSLVNLEPLSAEIFLHQDIKHYFGLGASLMKQLVAAYHGYKKEHDRAIKEEADHSKQTALLHREVSRVEVIEAIDRVGLAEPDTIDLVIAAYAAACLRASPPIWLLLVGAPSSFKTELIRLIDLPSIYSLDTLTENAFVSGFVHQDGSEPEDLLPMLDGKCFVIKDLTTMFSLREDTIKKILGDLTSIFDGRYEKFTATRGAVRYESRFSMLACVTPAILAKHSRYMHQLGGRFLSIGIPPLTDATRQKGYLIAWDERDRENLISSARQLMSTYCHQATERAKQKFFEVKVTDPNVRHWLNTAAQFMACARGTTMTKLTSFEKERGDGAKKETIEYIEVSDPQIEQPWRLLQQLKTLARILAAIRDESEVTFDALEPLKSIIISSMPTDRSEAITELLKEDRLLARELAERIDKSRKTAQRFLKELFALGLVTAEETNDPKSGYTSSGYSLKPEYKQLLNSFNQN